MNCLRSQVKCLFSEKFGNIFNNFSRAYKRPIPVEWHRPEKISCIHPRNSGDGGVNVDVTPKDYLYLYDKSTVLPNAPEEVKKCFTLEFNSLHDMSWVKRYKFMELVRRHKYDGGSMEAKIAKMTRAILHMQQQFKLQPTNGSLKRQLKEKIEKRRKHLKFMRSHDYKKFEFLLERLNLHYRPPAESNPRIYRKDGYRRLLDDWISEDRQKKLDAYKKELQEQQKDFFREKAEKLEFIRNEEIRCGVKPTISLEQIEEAKQKAAKYSEMSCLEQNRPVSENSL